MIGNTIWTCYYFELRVIDKILQEGSTYYLCINLDGTNTLHLVKPSDITKIL